MYNLVTALAITDFRFFWLDNMAVQERFHQYPMLDEVIIVIKTVREGTCIVALQTHLLDAPEAWRKFDTPIVAIWIDWLYDE